jgi:integrase
MLHAIFAHAARHGVIAANPASGARKMPNERRATRLSLDQYRKLGAAMLASQEHPTALAAVRLLALSGLRRGEALAMQPGWIIDSGINFPESATKTGAQRRPLGRAALDTIKSQAKAHGSDDWIFPAIRGDGGGHLIGVPRVLSRLCKAAGVPVIFPHALRHGFASIAAEIGFSELTIAGLLGHSAGSVTRGYVHLDRSLVAAADRVAEVIADALDGKARGEVVPMQEWRA